jgi:hypothetical protein
MTGLTGANLTNADLMGAVLAGANLQCWKPYMPEIGIKKSDRIQLEALP